MKRPFSIALVAASLSWMTAAACADAPAVRYQAAEIAGVVLQPVLSEISGLAASRRRDDVLWTVNDGDNSNEVFAIGTSGSLLARYTLDGVVNQDWEDIAAFELDGRPYLLLADVGDNNGARRQIAFIVVEEPVLDPQVAEATLAPAWHVRARYPDGARDCEAVAVDAAQGLVLLLSKRRTPAQLFTLPLRPAESAQPVEAQQVALVDGLPGPSAREIAEHPRMGRYFGQPTAMSLRADGAELAVLTYRDVYVFARTPGESWQQTLARKPQALHIPLLPQAEALGHTRDGGALYVTGEKLPAPLIRVRRKVSP